MYTHKKINTIDLYNKNHNNNLSHRKSVIIYSFSRYSNNIIKPSATLDSRPLASFYNKCKRYSYKSYLLKKLALNVQELENLISITRKERRTQFPKMEENSNCNTVLIHEDEEKNETEKEVTIDTIKNLSLSDAKLKKNMLEQLIHFKNTVFVGAPSATGKTTTLNIIRSKYHDWASVSNMDFEKVLKSYNGNIKAAVEHLKNNRTEKMIYEHTHYCPDFYKIIHKYMKVIKEASYKPHTKIVKLLLRSCIQDCVKYCRKILIESKKRDDIIIIVLDATADLFTRYMKRHDNGIDYKKSEFEARAYILLQLAAYSAFAYERHLFKNLYYVVTVKPPVLEKDVNDVYHLKYLDILGKDDFYNLGIHLLGGDINLSSSLLYLSEKETQKGYIIPAENVTYFDNWNCNISKKSHEILKKTEFIKNLNEIKQNEESVNVISDILTDRDMAEIADCNNNTTVICTLSSTDFVFIEKLITAVHARPQTESYVELE